MFLNVYCSYLHREFIQLILQDTLSLPNLAHDTHDEFLDLVLQSDIASNEILSFMGL